MDEPTDHEITRIFEKFAGDQTAIWRELMPLVHDQVRGVVARRLGRHARQANRVTTVVQEVFLRMRDWKELGPNRRAFFSKVADVVRYILMDRARKHAREAENCEKMLRQFPIAVEMESDHAGQLDLLALTEALERLRELGDEFSRWLEIIHLHWFGGFTLPEVATEIGVSPSTVEKEKRLLVAYLRIELGVPSAS